MNKPSASRDDSVKIRQEIPVLILLLFILAAGSFLRLRGINWDSFTHIHPDERFLTMVETSIKLPGSMGDYFNTSQSTLNPVNSGYSFFVYGTFPIFLVRAAAEYLGQTGYDEIHLVGRAFAAGFDIVSILLLYFLGRKISGRWVGLLTSAFYAFSVLPIQHSHFFVVDIFANTFIIAGMLCAYNIQQQGRLRDYVVFGIMLGLGSACKISSLPFAGVAVIAAALYFLKNNDLDARKPAFLSAAKGLSAAAVVSFLVFRIFQPYAFSGPGFFGMIPDANWIANIREISHQQSGEVDFPPALQWAHRTPVFFALKNMIVWGLGIPLGMAAWVGYMLALIGSIRKKKTGYVLILFWVTAFFLWQSTNNTPAMRYQLPVYPFLSFFAAWLLYSLWNKVRATPKAPYLRSAVVVLGLVLLGSSAVWAFAFSSIYDRSNTHVAASRWIYQNIPAGINLTINSADGESSEPLPLVHSFMVHPYSLQILEFSSDKTLEVDSIVLPSIRTFSEDPESWPELIFDLYQQDELLGSGKLLMDGTLQADTSLISFESMVPLYKTQRYRLEIRTIGDSVAELQGNILLAQGFNSDQSVEITLPRSVSLAPAVPYRAYLPGGLSGDLLSLTLPYVENLSTRSRDEDVIIRMSVFTHTGPEVAYQVEVSARIPFEEEIPVTFLIPDPIPVDNVSAVELELISGALIQLRGSNLVSESSWDLGLPARIDNRDGYGGLYQSGNLEMYWPDNQDDDLDGISDKLERIVDNLTAGDYLIISTNRQYGTIPRVPVRYPLSEVFYRSLFNCPEPQSVLSCGAYLEPDGHVSEVGFELVEVFASHPRIGSLVINDQMAEEAFTVYDHPKVLVFRKSSSFDEAQLVELLSEVDLSNIKNLPPAQLPRNIQTINLPEGLRLKLESAGTWSDIFNRDSLVNRHQLLAVMAWYLLIGFLGLTMVPVLFVLMPGLRDRGWGSARTLGLIVLAWLAWTAGNLGIPVTRLSLLIFLVFMAVPSLILMMRSKEMRDYLRNNRKQILIMEAVALLSFLVFLAVRYGNPDLWHPAKGGEKPMNFAYLNAVIKSTFFPPYNPWFSGGTINYYYFGYVIVGMPLKLLGILPSVGYNLILPTLFSLCALSAFSIAYNLIGMEKSSSRSRIMAGLAAVTLFVFLGNLGNARLFYRGLQDMGSEGESTSGFAGTAAAVRGVARYAFSSESMPVAMDRWYWDASRAVAPGDGEAGPITEFPLFTFLYGDLHAHMINLPLTALTLSFSFSWLSIRKRFSLKDWKKIIPLVALWGLSLGALRPTNTWDYPLFWLLSAISVGAAAWISREKKTCLTVVEAVLGITLLIGIAQGAFYFYDLWYLPGYTSAQLWEGSRTTLSDYFTVFGLFFFILYFWIIWETRSWMEQTPLSALSRIRPYTGLILFLILLLIIVITGLAWFGIVVSLITIPYMVWSSVLILFRKGLPLEKQIVLVLTAAGAAVTLMVEIIVLTGDISRMNTVFKFYLQVWTLLSISSAPALIWMFQDWDRMRGLLVGRIFSVGGIILVVGAAMYPLAAVPAKVNDRMTPETPNTLDGARFMEFSQYYDFGSEFDLIEDYHAIRWIQDNVEGSPVIVEAAIPEYRWGSRYSIHTGLPAVLGWNWHQRQQQVGSGAEEVSQRSADISRFYVTDSNKYAEQFLERYDVQYIIVGVLEHLYYGQIRPCQPASDGDLMYCDMSGRPMGMVQPELRISDCDLIDADNEASGYACPTGGFGKFDDMAQNGKLEQVFSVGSTIIYEVIR